MAGMRFAGIDRALELRVRQNGGGRAGAAANAGGRRAGRRDRGHGGRLHELGRMRLRAGNMDRLQRIAFVEAGGQTDGCIRPSSRGSRSEISTKSGIGAGRLTRVSCGAGGFRPRGDRCARWNVAGAGRGEAAVTGGRGGTRRRPDRAVRRHRQPFPAMAETRADFRPERGR